MFKVSKFLFLTIPLSGRSGGSNCMGEVGKDNESPFPPDNPKIHF